MIKNSKLLLFFFFFFIHHLGISQSGPRQGNKFGKKEIEFSLLPGIGERGEFGAIQLLYRHPLACRFKIGGGLHLSVDEEKGGSHPGGLIDLSLHPGYKQKWSIHSQLGKALYERSFSYPGINGSRYLTRENKEFFFQSSIQYRMNLGKKFVFTTGVFLHTQKFKSMTEVWDSQNVSLNPFEGISNYRSGGVRLGLIF